MSRYESSFLAFREKMRAKRALEAIEAPEEKEEKPAEKLANNIVADKPAPPAPQGPSHFPKRQGPLLFKPRPITGQFNRGPLIPAKTLIADQIERSKKRKAAAAAEEEFLLGAEKISEDCKSYLKSVELTKEHAQKMAMDFIEKNLNYPKMVTPEKENAPTINLLCDESTEDDPSQMRAHRNSYQPEWLFTASQPSQTTIKTPEQDEVEIVKVVPPTPSKSRKTIEEVFKNYQTAFGPNTPEREHDRDLKIALMESQLDGLNRTVAVLITQNSALYEALNIISEKLKK